MRVNVEADSLNGALLLPGESADSLAFGLLVREVVREMTIKSGQKCTAIRRVLVPDELYQTAADAIAAKLAGVTVGNPRNEKVRMGSLVSRAQLEAVTSGIDKLRSQTEVIHDGAGHPLVDADPSVPRVSGRRCSAPVNRSGRIWYTTSRCSVRSRRSCRTAISTRRSI